MGKSMLFVLGVVAKNNLGIGKTMYVGIKMVTYPSIN